MSESTPRTTTTNYNLILPQYDETADIKDINDNMIEIDRLLKLYFDSLAQAVKWITVNGSTLSPTGGTINIGNVISSASNAGVTLAWGETKTLGTVGNVNITAKMPANPNTWPAFTTKTYVLNNAGIPAGSYIGVKGSSFTPNVETPTGYSPVAIASVNTGNQSVSLIGANAMATGESDVMVIKNTSSGPVDLNLSISILYKQNG